jgi:hypothetical protein
MHQLDTICSITFIKKDKFQRINLFIQNLLIYKNFVILQKEIFEKKK